MGMGAYEMGPLGAVQEHLAGLEGDGIGNAERMLDAAEAQAGIGSDAVQAAAGFGKYMLEGYEQIPTAGLGGLGAELPAFLRNVGGGRSQPPPPVVCRGQPGTIVGLKNPGILSKIGGIFSGRPPPPMVVHPSTPGCFPAVIGPDSVARPIGGPPLAPAQITQPVDKALAIHVRSPADVDMLPGSSLGSYAGIFSEESTLGTSMEPLN
jgi:hypothetical protein